MASVAKFIAFSWFVLVVKADVFLQNTEYCGSYRKPNELRILDLDEFVVQSHSVREFYAPNADCIVTIIGKQYHQWEIKLINLDIGGEEHKCDRYSPCCNDYLKIFNSYRVDYARLLPSIPWRGLCGNELPRKTIFVTTQNFVTIQFNSDIRRESKKGFTLQMRQFPRKNAGTEFYQNGYAGGWNDGTLMELQIDWSAQETIPGDYRPGLLPDFEFDPNGVSCYECTACAKEYFDSSDIGITKKDGCFVCIKEWVQGMGQANRACLSRNQYRDKLLTYRDLQAQDERVTDFRECRTLARGEEGNMLLTMCVCESDLCNSGQLLRVPWLHMFIFTSMITLLSYVV